MKWVFYVIVLVWMFYRTVYALKPIKQAIVENTLTVDDVSYGEDDFLKVGGHITISCKPSSKNQKVEWLDPNGHVVKRMPSSRIFSQSHFVSAMRGRPPALVLTITRATVEDSGVYQCRSEDLVQNVTLCVLEPSDFTDTPAELLADMGRSITLSCQAKGDPEPRISWVRNGETISDDDSSGKYRVMTKYNIQGFEGLLTITSLEPEDSGVYTCLNIQESLQAENCSHTSMFNITLNVNYPPIFAGENKTQFVYGNTDELVDIVCSADGYPAPTYRFFKEMSNDVMFEFDQNQIKLLDDGSKAVVTVVANKSTFWKRFKCQATNEHGVSEQYFSVLKADKPKKPDVVSLYNSTSDSVFLNIIWNNDIQFPISAFDVQYLTEGGRSFDVNKPATWKRSKQSEVSADDVLNIDPEINGLVIQLEGLEAETNYWVRLRVTNEVGESLWSDPLKVSTGEKEEEEEAVTEDPEAESEVSEDEGSMTETTFYGIFFFGGIFVVSFVCMFAMRMIK
ncbi:hypothetical protein PYW07_002165 [Mythimna separata]|uniref:Hemolin n=1 Tax=Mythimna separata TaxID=271217 RepID=A0AAD8DT69_MYTSE|nr:hypothetical protein PYW07_002165 [Mythimna separata]